MNELYALQTIPTKASHEYGRGCGKLGRCTCDIKGSPRKSNRRRGGNPTFTDFPNHTTAVYISLNDLKHHVYDMADFSG